MDKDPAWKEKLRQKAERLAAEKKYAHPEEMTGDEVRAALHQLQVHQIELEMQNEELRRAQAEIEAARERYFDLYDLAPVGYCTLSEKGIILEANLTAAGLFGAVRGELIGKPFSGFICKEDQDTYYLHKLRLFEKEEPQSFELRMKRCGAFFWADINAAVLQDKDGQQVCRITISDITQRKRAEEALRESEQRANELVEELRKADKGKNEFLSALSHELRNPLAAISAGIQLLDITTNEDQIKKAKNIMNRQMNQLGRLVDDLLDLTRITYNRIELIKENFELNKLAKIAAEDYNLLFEKKGVMLSVKTSGNPIDLYADPARVKQIIGNLLQNSLKYTQTRGITILKIYEENKEAIISVKDNGIGICPEMMPKLFRPFMQADMPLDRSGGGLGLGLSITKGITELHGGSVSAYSDGQGKGSEFFIRLPITVKESREETDTARQEESDAQALKILIIEDNRDFVELLSAMLSAMGHTVNIAYDGIEGIKQAKQIRPDFIFCDIGMPGMNGYEVAEKIRNDNDLRNVQLIALTGYAGENDAEHALKTGFNKHLAKPIDIATLKYILRAERK